jgi:hypothetical protein
LWRSRVGLYGIWADAMDSRSGRCRRTSQGNGRAGGAIVVDRMVVERMAGEGGVHLDWDLWRPMNGVADYVTTAWTLQ